MRELTNLYTISQHFMQNKFYTKINEISWKWRSMILIRKSRRNKRKLLNQIQCCSNNKWWHTTQSLHMWDGHAENCQLVWFACKWAAGWHHVTQLIHVCWHFIPSPTLDLTVTFPNTVNNQYCQPNITLHGNFAASCSMMQSKKISCI